MWGKILHSDMTSKSPSGGMKKMTGEATFHNIPFIKQHYKRNIMGTLDI